MGYRVLDPDEVEPAADRPCECRRLSDPAGLERMAINLFRADPGEELPLAYHYHDEQEEAFYVVAGTLHVRTPEETYVVEEGGLFVVDPGSPQLAYNHDDADETAEVVAIGAPPVRGDVHEYEP